MQLSQETALAFVAPPCVKLVPVPLRVSQKINHSDLRVFHIQKSPLAGVETPAAKSVVLRARSKEQVTELIIFSLNDILQQRM